MAPPALNDASSLALGYRSAMLLVLSPKAAEIKFDTDDIRDGLISGTINGNATVCII